VVKEKGFYSKEEAHALKVENNLSDGTKDSRVLAVRKGGSFCFK
jgi:hypothetical protein